MPTFKIYYIDPVDPEEESFMEEITVNNIQEAKDKIDELSDVEGYTGFRVYNESGNVVWEKTSGSPDDGLEDLPFRTFDRGLE